MAYNKKYQKPQVTSEEKRRVCLFCRENFISTWPGNRICQKCKGSQSFRAGGSPERTI